MRTMSITVDEEIYLALKKTVGARRMSKFIGDAVREKLAEQLAEKDDELFREYAEASRDSGRNKELDDWAAIETEGWE